MAAAHEKRTPQITVGIGGRQPLSASERQAWLFTLRPSPSAFYPLPSTICPVISALRPLPSFSTDTPCLLTDTPPTPGEARARRLCCGASAILYSTRLFSTLLYFTDTLLYYCTLRSFPPFPQAKLGFDAGSAAQALGTTEELEAEAGGLDLAAAVEVHCSKSCDVVYTAICCIIHCRQYNVVCAMYCSELEAAVGHSQRAPRMHANPPHPHPP